MSNVVINDFSSQTVSQADDSFVIQEAGGTTKKMSKLLLAQSIAYAGYKSYDNFTGSRPSVSTVTVGWTQLGIEGIIAGAQSLTLDITASGLLGLDTGAEAADAWYYVFAIAKTDGTVSAILSASSTAPTMPAGYTLKRLVSMARNTSGDFVDFVQEGDNWGYVANTTIKAAGTFIAETLNCETFIPALVSEAVIRLYATSTGAGVSLIYGALYSYLNGVYVVHALVENYNGVSGGTVRTALNNILSVSSRHIKYYATDGIGGATGSFALSISSFKVPL